MFVQFLGLLRDHLALLVALLLSRSRIINLQFTGLHVPLRSASKSHKPTNLRPQFILERSILHRPIRTLPFVEELDLLHEIIDVIVSGGTSGEIPLKTNKIVKDVFVDLELLWRLVIRAGTRWSGR